MNLLEYLYTLKVQELKEICKKSSINGISRLKKSELCEIMAECDLVGIPDGLILEKSELSPIPEESELPCCHGSDDPLCDKCFKAEEIILHLPIKPDALKVSQEKWLNMFKKGKKILENGNAHTHK
tara:strand:- start:1851 stop:2228 length:378 start_codon:yes stop_codon:yes gene_type:complete